MCSRTKQRYEQRGNQTRSILQSLFQWWYLHYPTVDLLQQASALLWKQSLMLELLTQDYYRRYSLEEAIEKKKKKMERRSPMSNSAHLSSQINMRQTLDTTSGAGRSMFQMFVTEQWTHHHPSQVMLMKWQQRQQGHRPCDRGWSVVNWLIYDAQGHDEAATLPGFHGISDAGNTGSSDGEVKLSFWRGFPRYQWWHHSYTCITSVSTDDTFPTVEYFICKV